MQQTRLLVAEDDRDQQRLLLRALTESHPLVTVTLTSTHGEILAAAASSSFDCVILDYNLPPHTAPEILNRLHELQPGVPVVVVSSSECQSVVIESIRSGGADFVPKIEAFRRGVLWQRVRTAIESARAERVERRLLHRRLRELETCAHRDPLTGLRNRRGMELALRNGHRCGSQPEDRRRSTAIFMIDLDHFKRINDSFGHNVGDDVLRATADVLRAQALPGDLVCRWGGEEFLVLRQSIGLVDAFAWAHALRAHISDTVKLPNAAWAITASIGVDIVPCAELSSEVVSRADRAMYLAKDTGRDRVCTGRMAEILELAHDVGSLPGLSVRQQLDAVLRRIGRSLGPTQLAHVGGHGQDVGRFARAIAPHLFASQTTREAIELASRYHDIRKVAISEHLLAVPRALSKAERVVMDEHAKFGAEIFRAVGASEEAAEAVRMHHRRFDARGLIEPREVCPGDVLNACDAFATMLGDRPYAPAKRPARALAELRAQRGAQFHPSVVDSLHVVGSGLLRFTA